MWNRSWDRRCPWRQGPVSWLTSSSATGSKGRDRQTECSTTSFPVTYFRKTSSIARSSDLLTPAHDGKNRQPEVRENQKLGHSQTTTKKRERALTSIEFSQPTL